MFITSEVFTKMAEKISDSVNSELNSSSLESLNEGSTSNIEKTDMNQSEKVEATQLKNEDVKIGAAEEFKTVDQVLENASPAEKEVYEKAALEKTEVNERETLMRTDLDYDAKDQFGRTNLERMEDGLSPLLNNEPIELHHIKQEMDSPLAELTKEEHRGEGNYSILHDVDKESTINRTIFNAEKEAHWKERAEEIIQVGGVA